MVRRAWLVPAALVLALAGAGAPAADDEACEQRGGESGAAAMRVELLQSGVKLADAVLVSGRRGAEVSLANRTSEPHAWTGWGTRLPEPEMSATPASREAASAAVLRPTDVVVITFPKTGTTWLQQICELLRTGGNMDFMEITERQPWLDLAYDCGVDMDADQHAEPRIFKSHQQLAAVNTGAKYISIVRNPKDVIQSVFRFEKAKGIPPFADFDNVNDYAATGHFEIANIWEFYTQLWRARKDPNVLIQSYEELVKDESAYLPGIAEFLGVQLDSDLRQTVLHMSSKGFMLEHATQFDDNYIMNECSNGPLEGSNEDASQHKVTTEHRNEVNSTILAQLQSVWNERVLPRTMLKDYDAMSVALAALARGRGA